MVVRRSAQLRSIADAHVLQQCAALHHPGARHRLVIVDDHGLLGVASLLEQPQPWARRAPSNPPKIPTM